MHPVIGHLGCMEFMVQPTQSFIKRLGVLRSKIISELSTKQRGVV
jgi:hypothetical protein